MEVPVSSSLGSMGPLLRQLESLEHSRRWKGVPAKAEIQLLREDLEGLCSDLKDLSESEHTLSFTARCWMSLVRELCYDTEDYLDEVMHSAAGVRRRSIFRRKKGDIFFRIDRKTKWHSSPHKRKLKRMRSPQIAKDFSELMARVEDATEKRQRFQLGPKTTIKPDTVGRQAGVSRLTLQLSRQVLECPKYELVKLLTFDDHDDDDGEKKEQLKVVPIFGFAGVGKTTVARTLYHRYGGEFQCRAFLRVSRNPDLRRLLTSMLSQIKAPQANAFSDVQDLIDTIREQLQGKRYFIVVDDLWTASVWDTISRAFPAGDCRSRIITTTQIVNVALACCSYQSEYIFKMAPLNDYEPKRLFFNRVFGSEGCPKDLKEVSDGIIRKCGDLPLAIVNIASLLVREPNFAVEQWKCIQDSLPSIPRTNPTSAEMKEVVKFIYNNLPPRLKTCLLYLSMYPEGYTIRKDELVKQWVAEGLLEGQDAEQTAGVYFDELVSRGMIQPADINYDGKDLSCTVHHMVQELIRYKSVEENFVTIVDYSQTTPGLPDKVRRLSVQFGGAKSAKIPASLRLSQVRSLLFCGFFKCVPSILHYGLLRVLILHIWADQDETSFDLTGIRELFRLRYLKIECNVTVKLPDKIIGLQYLWALQVDARLSAVPSDIVDLLSLFHLSLPSEATLPLGFGHMKSLRTLGYFDLSKNSAENVLDLGKLTNLQDLHLTCSRLQPDNLERNMECLGSILRKLSSLKCLTLVPAGSSRINTPGDAGASIMSFSCDGLSSLSSPPALLETLELSWRCCIFSSLPKWTKQLANLRVLKIAVGELLAHDIDVLGGLPALNALSLYVQAATADRIVFGKAGFSVLRYFKFRCSVPWLKFEVDAMPNLQKLKLQFNAPGVDKRGAAYIRIEHLSGLEEISAKIGVTGAYAKSALTTAIGNHPKNPRINVQFVDHIFYDEQSMGTKEKEHMTQDEHEGEDEKIQADSRLSVFPLDHSLSEMDRLVNAMRLLLSKADSDSFENRVEMYYLKRPALITYIERLYRIYCALAEHCEKVAAELCKKNIPSGLESPGSLTALESSLNRFNRVRGFHVSRNEGDASMEGRVRVMLGLMGEDGDSFARREEIYLMSSRKLWELVDYLGYAHGALAESYDRVDAELRFSPEPHKPWKGKERVLD